MKSRPPYHSIIAGAMLIISASTQDPEAVATLAFILAALLAVRTDMLDEKVRRHQQALKWFSDHVYIRSQYLDPDTPEDLEDLVGKED